MAFVTLADTSALSRTFALKYDQDVDPNQEIVALGAANVAAGFFQGFPVSASTSRTAVAEAAGGKSQLVGVVGAVAIVVLLLFAGGLTTNLPQASLAAIVIVAGTSLFDLAPMRWLWRVRRTEFVLCLGGAARRGAGRRAAGHRHRHRPVLLGLPAAGCGGRTTRPSVASTAATATTTSSATPRPSRSPGSCIFRFDAPLFFANAEHFARAVKKHVAERGEPVHRVIIAGEPITDIDTTGAESLRDLLERPRRTRRHRSRSPSSRARCSDRLRRYGVYERIGDENFFSTIGHAVHEYREETGEEPEAPDGGGAAEV